MRAPGSNPQAVSQGLLLDSLLQLSLNRGLSDPEAGLCQPELLAEISASWLHKNIVVLQEAGRVTDHWRNLQATAQI